LYDTTSWNPGAALTEVPPRRSRLSSRRWSATEWTTDPVVGPKFVAAKTSFRVNHTDPDGDFLLDATSNPAVLYVGAGALAREAEVELTMTAEDGHQCWLGQLNLPVALAKRKKLYDIGERSFTRRNDVTRGTGWR
jgi:hypothetical protein